MDFRAILLFVSVVACSVAALDGSLQCLTIIDSRGRRRFLTNSKAQKRPKIVDNIVEAICFDPALGLLVYACVNE